MELSLLLKVNRRPAIVKGQIAELVLDATLVETHSYSSRVTQFPIEDGTTISDNIINDPVNLSITGFVTNSPLLDSKDKSKITLDSLPPPLYRAQAAFSDLLTIRNAKVPVSVVTSLKVYTNMVMVNLSVPKDSNTGDSIEFSAEFTQIVIVSNRKVKLEQVKPVVRHTASKSKDNYVSTLVPKQAQIDLFTAIAVPDHTRVVLPGR